MARYIEEQTVVHQECGATVIYETNEVQESEIKYDFGGGSAPSYYIVCPKCGLRIEVKK